MEGRLQQFVETANEIYVKAVVDHYLRAVDRFGPLTVSLYSAVTLPYGLITSDNPVVLARDGQLNDVGGPTPVPLLEAASSTPRPIGGWERA